MKYIICALFAAAVIRFLYFILLDTINSLLMQQKKQTKSKSSKTAAPVYESRTTYNYRKAQ